MWIAFLFLIFGFCITDESPDCLKKIKKEICCLAVLLLWECFQSFVLIKVNPLIVFMIQVLY